MDVVFWCPNCPYCPFCPKLREMDNMDKKDKMVMLLFYNSHAGFFGRVPAVANNRSIVLPFSHRHLVIVPQSRVFCSNLKFFCKYAHILGLLANFLTKIPIKCLSPTGTIIFFQKILHISEKSSTFAAAKVWKYSL